MKMKKFLILGASIFICTILLVSLHIKNTKEIVNIQKIDYSVFSKNKKISGMFFYEKPIISNKYLGAEKINRYFEEDCNNTFDGSSLFFGNDSFKKMKQLLKQGAERWGEDAIQKQPYCFYVLTRVTFASEEYVSFCQTYVWAADGKKEIRNQGLTFSLETGNRESFIKFSDVDDNELKTAMYDALLSEFMDVPIAATEIRDMFISDTEVPFSIMIRGTEIPFDKNFFYDGHSVNVTMDPWLSTHNGLICKWDIRNIDSMKIFLKDTID